MNKGISLLLNTFIVFLIAISIIFHLQKLKRVKGPDFRQNYLMAKNLIEVKALYGISFKDYQDKLAKEEKTPSGFTSPHPPTAALCFIPYLNFDEHSAYVLHGALALSLIVIITYLLFCAFNLKALALAAVLIALWYGPNRDAIYYGQIGIFLYIALIGAYLLIRNNYHILAGILIGVAISIKLYPMLLLVLLVARRNWRTLFAALGSFTLLIVATGLLSSFSEWLLYFKAVAPQNFNKWSGFPVSISLSGLTTPLFIDTIWSSSLLNVPLAASLCSMLFIVGGVYLLYRLTRLSNLSQSALFPLYLLAMLLLAPVSHPHSFILTWPAILSFYHADKTRACRIKGLLLVAFFLAISSFTQVKWWTISKDFNELLGFSSGSLVCVYFVKLHFVILVSVFCISAYRILTSSSVKEQVACSKL